MEEIFLDDYKIVNGNYECILSNNEVVSVPKADIDHFISKAKMTEIDSIEMWLSDNGFLDNEEQNTLDKVAKKVKIKKGVEQAKRKSDKPRTVKISDEKQALFTDIVQNLQEIYGENVEIAKENKLITVKINDILFKIDIIQTRNKKN